MRNLGWLICFMGSRTLDNGFLQTLAMPSQTIIFAYPIKLIECKYHHLFIYLFLHEVTEERPGRT